jgi:transposase
MTLLPPGEKVHLAFGYIDMRKGIDGLAMLVQGVLRQDPFSGHLFVFRGRTISNCYSRPRPDRSWREKRC